VTFPQVVDRPFKFASSGAYQNCNCSNRTVTGHRKIEFSITVEIAKRNGSWRSSDRERLWRTEGDILGCNQFIGRAEEHTSGTT